MNKFVHVVFVTLALIQAPRPSRAEEPSPDGAPLAAVARLRDAGDLAGAATLASNLVHGAGAPLETHVAYQDVMRDLGRDSVLELEYRGRARAEGATADDLYLYARLLRGPRAVAQYRAALKTAPAHFQALCGCANELLDGKDVRGAERAFETARGVRPASGLPWNGLGRVAEARGAPTDAEAAYRKAIELSPKLVVARVNLGVLLVGVGRATEALAVLDEAAKAAPKDPLPLVAKGVAHARGGRGEEALVSFEAALALDGKSVSTLVMLATTYVNLGKLDLAEKAVKRAVELAPTSVAARVAAASFRLAADDCAGAREAAQAAIGLDADNAMAHFLLARALDRGGEPRKAEPSYRLAVKLDGTNAVLVRGLAQHLGRQGRWKDAVKSFQRVVELTGASAESTYDLGLAQIGANDPRAAAGTFDALVAEHPERVDGWLKLGIVCRERLHEERRALKAFRAYLEKGGKDARVKAWIDELEKSVK
jgi:Tfp pilus assembly protein PilF